jgi:hypothetical protein
MKQMGRVRRFKGCDHDPSAQQHPRPYEKRLFKRAWLLG